MNPRQHIRSIRKGFGTIELLNAAGRAGVADIARDLGVPRTTAHRILETLTAAGVAARDPDGRYGLTREALALASGFTATDLMVEQARPVLDALALSVKWPLALTTPRGEDMVVRLATDHDTPLAIERYAPGFATPLLHATTGRCWLAILDDDARCAVIDMLKRSRDDRQHLARAGAKLDRVLEDIRARGHCHIRFKEFPEGSLGVPVLQGGRPAGGLVMRYIKSALDPDEAVARFAPLLKAAAARIGAK